MSSESSVLFAYEAVGADAVRVSGQVMASSVDHASSMIANRGLHATKIRLGRTPTPLGSMPLDAAADGVRMLAQLLETGVPLDRALAVMAASPTRHWSASRLADVRSALSSGRTLAAALRDARVPLPEDALSFIHAGESAGTRQVALDRTAAVLEKRALRRREVRAALAYPAVVAALGIVSLSVLVGVVLPRFATLLLDVGIPVPRSLAILLAVGALGRILIIPLLALTALGAMALRSPWFRNAARVTWVHGVLLSLPVVGRIRHALATERALGMISEMLRAGVPLARSIRIAASAASDHMFVQRLQACEESLRSGLGFARCIEMHKLGDATCVQLVRIGEEAGRLGEMLERAASRERELAETRLRAAVRVLEPALIIGCGIAVGVVAASVLNAIYSIRPA